MKFSELSSMCEQGINESMVEACKKLGLSEEETKRLRSVVFTDVALTEMAEQFGEPAAGEMALADLKARLDAGWIFPQHHAEAHQQKKELEELVGKRPKNIGTELIPIFARAVALAAKRDGVSEGVADVGVPAMWLIKVIHDMDGPEAAAELTEAFAKILMKHSVMTDEEREEAGEIARDLVGTVRGTGGEPDDIFDQLAETRRQFDALVAPLLEGKDPETQGAVRRANATGYLVDVVQDTMGAGCAAALMEQVDKTLAPYREGAA